MWTKELGVIVRDEKKPPNIPEEKVCGSAF
jgi:hypothetical protein